MKFWKRRELGTEPKEPKERKPGLLKRRWRKFRRIDWKNSVNRWKLLFTLFAGLVLAGVFTYTAIALTSTPAFCSSCHEMAPEYQSFSVTSHNQIKCTQCHIPPGAKNLVVHKISALKEVYLHFTKQQPNPIKMSEPIPNEVCMQCHSRNRLVTATGDLKVNHDKHVEKQIPCVTCHKGVSHAKVVERGLNTNDQYDYWNDQNVKKLVADTYTRPNMGTCIDCHEQVNQGKEPWKEETALKENEQKVSGQPTDMVEDPKQKEEQREKTVTRILQALGKQQQGEKPKISMDCFTCHKEINTPKNHDIKNWSQNHGQFALQELNKCQKCHQESKWIKEMPKESITVLLSKNYTEKPYQPNLAEVKTHARESSFCSTCHKNRPPEHLDSDRWLTAHAEKAKNLEKRSECFVCHDYAKTPKTNAPTDVYCKYCHRTGLKDMPNNP